MAELSQQLKNDNWDFFVEAKSGDPTHKIPGCENLTENLIAACEILGTNEYNERLERCKVWCDRAHHFYYIENNTWEAVRHCNAVMRELTVLIYESKGRFANAKGNAFRGIQQQEVKKIG